jgi:hypothetical protein
MDMDPFTSLHFLAGAVGLLFADAYEVVLLDTLILLLPLFGPETPARLSTVVERNKC